MFVYGFAYGNDANVRGFNQSGIAKTAAAAQRELKRALVKGGTAEEDIYFKESDSKKGNFRAWTHSNEGSGRETATNYVFFKLPQTWILIDVTKAPRVIQDAGELEELQFAARKYAEVTGKFKRDGDSIKVAEGVYLVRIH